MNLIEPFPGDPVPAADVQPAPQPVPCPATRVVIIGGSFSHALLDYLHRASCNPPAVEFEYWRAYTLTWGAHGIELQPGVDPARRAADIRAADLLIYEENEEILRHPLHGEALWQFLHDEPT